MKSMKKKSWLKTTLCVLVACAILGTIVSAILFNGSKGNPIAYASVEFSFDGAANGIAPNGYAFSADDIASDAVLNEALAAAGMADRYTAEQIRKQLKVSGVYPENIVQQMTSYESLLDFSANREVMAKVYHPTLYSVVLDGGFDKSVPKADLEKLLQCILTAYRSYFAGKYAVGAQPAALPYDLEQYDYPQRLTLLKRSLQESADYAAELYEKNPSLRKDGAGFNDIAVRLNNLISSDLDKMNASMTINALTGKKERLKTQYQYSKETLENEYKKREDQKKNLTALIDSYKQDEEMYLSTANGATQIESNTTATYEELQKHLETVNNRIIAISSSVQRYIDLLSDLGVSSDTAIGTEGTETEMTVSPVPDETETGETALSVPDETPAETSVVSQEEYDRHVAELEQDIAGLVARREEIMASFSELIALYNGQQINDLTVAVSAVKYDAPSLLSGAFIKQTLKVAGPICAVGFMVCVILIIISRRKEEKAALQQ